MDSKEFKTTQSYRTCVLLCSCLLLPSIVLFSSVSKRWDPIIFLIILVYVEVKTMEEDKGCMTDHGFDHWFDIMIRYEIILSFFGLDKAFVYAELRQRFDQNNEFLNHWSTLFIVIWSVGNCLGTYYVYLREEGRQMRLTWIGVGPQQWFFAAFKDQLKFPSLV